MKTCSLARFAAAPELAAIGLDQGTADGQPHADTPGFCGEKGIEDLFRCCGIDARPLVLYRDVSLASIFIGAHGNAYLSTYARTVHGVDTILQKYCNHLADLQPVCFNPLGLG